MQVKELAAKIQPELVELRRYFHQHPEPSWEEVNTANRIAEELAKLGISVERKAKTGVVGTLKGTRPGRTVALRADIDALSIKEETGLPFASQNEGYMHACGHDAHITCLLGAAKILSQLKDEIAGTVKFIFQPAEELAQGAKKLVEEGAMDGVDGIFGLHVWGDLPAGKISVDPGPRMASADMFVITVEGKGGHGSAPHQGVDAVVVASAIVMNLQTIVSREISPLEPVVVSIGKIVAGDRFNIIASKAVLDGTSRCFNPEIRKNLPDIIRRIAENTAATFRAKAKVEYQFGCGATINDEHLTEIAKGSVKKLYGEETLAPMPLLTGSEDFSFYAEKAPATFAFLGICNPEKGTCFPQHHSHYTIDEDALQVGAAVYAQFALDFLAEKK
jgi:amidohydrolase